MANGEGGAVVRQVRTLFNAGTTGDLTDEQLLERYRSGKGDAAGLAFAALVERHGPMVLRACRAVLRDRDDALDAFQATFLVLVRRARSLWVRDSLGAWLHQVAHRTASCARADTARRRRHEQRAARLAARHGPERGHDDLGAVLHEEIARLPDRYRAAVVLCLLEGLTREQAALRLGCPTGTVESRLARGRERLRVRLARRGLASGVVAAATATCVAEGAKAPLPPGLAESTIQAALRFAAGGDAAAGATSASVAALAERMLRTMLMIQVRAVAAALAVFGGVAIGAGALAQTDGVDPPAPRRVPEVFSSPPIAEPVPSTDRILKLPGPGPGQRIEIAIGQPGKPSEWLTLTPDGDGTFLVRRETRGEKGQTLQEFICSGVRVDALRVPTASPRLPNLPQLGGFKPAQVNAVVAGLVEGVGGGLGGFKPAQVNAAEPDHERRLRRMEQTLERILKTLESRDDAPTSTPRPGPGL